MPSAPPGGAAAPAVKIEAQFVVGEYEIVILSANDSAALDAWLRQNKYNIPAGAEPILRPYVQQGMKFFVAKVDVSKVKMKGGQAMLSPLRFYYDTELFSLPVRLGLLNSSGTQDLIVHILAQGQRYEVANYDNVTIPTNFEVANQTVKRFGEFYVALFDEVMKRNPKSVVTEYAWDASSCDPCPSPALDTSELATLGADVLPSSAPAPPMGGPPGGPPMRRGPVWRGGFVLTRLHTRYSKDLLGEDLVFKQAPPIVGGREFMGANGKLEHAAREDSMNNFQGRYIIRHPWTGPIACKNPVRGRWGGPPANAGGNQRPKPALDLAFTPRDTPLKTFAKPEVAGWVRVSKGNPMGIAASIGKGAPSPEPESSAAATASAPPDATAPAPTSGEPVGPPAQGPDAGCGSCAVGHRGRGSETFGLALCAAAALACRRRRRRRGATASGSR